MSDDTSSATQKNNNSIEDSNKVEDFRQKQIRELEQLQKVLDENNLLRAKYNALQTQVAPQIDDDSIEADTTTNDQPKIDRFITEEEVEAMKIKLEQTLAEYRAETLIASKLNSEIEKMHADLSSLKMKFRLDQDQRLSAQNASSAEALANFKAKTVQIQETWDLEKQRLEKQIGFLQKVYESSVSDIREFEEQTRANNKGIQHLSSSINIAKEDIRDFTDQLQKIEPKLKEYEELQKKHQQSEILVVELSDQYEQLKNQVETESLTANVRRQIEIGQKTVSDLNRQIETIQCETTSIMEKSKEMKAKISELEAKMNKTIVETDALKRVSLDLQNQKKVLLDQLRECRELFELRGGENSMMMKEIADGVTIDQPAWAIRRQILSLKNDVKDMERIEQRQAVFETKLNSAIPAVLSVPQRKRVPLIPMPKQK